MESISPIHNLGAVDYCANSAFLLRVIDFQFPNEHFGSVLMRDGIILSLPIGESFIFNIGVLKQRTLLGTPALSIQIFIGILVNVTSGRDRSIRM